VRISEVAERTGVNPGDAAVLRAARPVAAAAAHGVGVSRLSGGDRAGGPFHQVRALGFGLSEVAELLDLAAGGPDDPEVLRARVAAVRAVMAGKVRDLAALREGLRRFADSSWDGPPANHAPLWARPDSDGGFGDWR
jgi:hypothetical protein